MKERRGSGFEVLPISGAILRTETMRWWLGEIERRAETPVIERLSERDAFCQSVEAESRKRERVA